MLTVDQLWDFSLQFYAKPNVAKLCIALQDNAKLNVNVLLLCRLLDKEQQMLHTQSLHQIAECAVKLDASLLTPLRHIRRSIPQTTLTESQALDIKKQLLSVELHLEKTQQEQLVAALLRSQLTPSHHNTTHNTLNYVELLATPNNEATQHTLKQLLLIPLE